MLLGTEDRSAAWRQAQRRGNVGGGDRSDERERPWLSGGNPLSRLLQGSMPQDEARRREQEDRGFDGGGYSDRRGGYSDQRGGYSDWRDGFDDWRSNIEAKLRGAQGDERTGGGYDDDRRGGY